MEVTTDPGRAHSGGLAQALWTLAKPAGFESREPAHELRYRNRRTRGVPPVCDVYVPDGAGPHPSVLLVHGGGFVIGHRRMKPVRLLATRLCEAGFAVCSIDYRLLFRGGGLEAQLEDVDAAARFWRESCERFGCDPARTSLAGFSAGAALMLIHAGRSGVPYHRVVSFYGPGDFSRVEGRRAGFLLRNVLGTSDRRSWRRLSPLEHAPRIEAPTLMIHGLADRMVPPQHAEWLHAARLAAGRASELELYPSMPHGWLNDAQLPETDAAIARAIAFLRA